MNIAYDLHGVITENPELYKIVMEFNITKGDKVWVISGPPQQQVKAELEALGFIKDKHYHYIIGVVDYLINQHHKYTIDPKGNYWFDEKTWWASKAEICKTLSMNVITDNEIGYGKYFDRHPTNFILVKHWPDGQISRYKLFKSK